MAEGNDEGNNDYLHRQNLIQMPPRNYPLDRSNEKNQAHPPAPEIPSSTNCKIHNIRRRRRPRILLGITGSIAAVKGPRLALRLANELKAHVKVVLTRTVEKYFWKEGRAVSAYESGESWRELLERVVVGSTTESTEEEEEEDRDDWRLSNGKIFIHCEC